MSPKAWTWIRIAGVWAIGFATPAAQAKTGPAHPPLRFYVATSGNDNWSGHLPAPNGQRTDGPFATLQRARRAIRAWHKSGAARQGGAVVLVRHGTYFLHETFTLTKEDSGAPGAPILYAAFPGEDVRLAGGRVVKDFQPVKDPAVRKRLGEETCRHVLWADLKAQGITNFGPASQGSIELFFMDKPMTLARWPNKGFTKIADIVVRDGHKIHGIPGSTVGKFRYTGDRPARWVGEKDPWLHGYWFWDWSEQRQRIESIDTSRHIISLAKPYHNYGYRKGQWYYALNMLCELDTPGEWYLDRQNGHLYFWPPAPLAKGRTVVSILPTLVAIDDVAHVGIRGFVLEAVRAAAVTVRQGTGVEIANCIVRNTGAGGVSVAGSKSGVTGCEIYQVGGTGIALNGGNRKTLVPAGLYAENNHIHNYARIRRMYSPGISLIGVGNRAVNNLIHTAPHMGIFFSGNDHAIERNEIHHVCLESNDAGAIYAGRNWTMRGNQIRYNYLHHITGFRHRGCVGVYLDDMFASADIFGNIFFDVTRAAFLGGGRDCTIENNIFVDCRPAIHVDARALGWAHGHADQWIAEAHKKGTISGIAYDKPPYSTRYPQLVGILQDEPKAPKGNRIARNICVGGTWKEVDKKAAPYLIWTDNLVDIDPKFVNRARHDFRLRADSPALRRGFQPIPVETIGPFKGKPARSVFQDLLQRAAAAKH